MSEGGRLAILSDTHGRLPERVLRSCGGAAHILHAGDVGDESFLQILGAVAPLTVVSGNVDPPGMVPFRARIEIAGWRILIQHVVWERGGPSPEVRDGLSREGADLVVFGHSHEPLCQMSGGTVFLNPGSCGPKRFSLPRTFGEARLRPEQGVFRLFDLDSPEGAPPFLEARFKLRA